MKRGYTMIEILIVIAIIGILVSLLFTEFKSNHVPTTGIVVRKVYTPAHTTLVSERKRDGRPIMVEHNYGEQCGIVIQEDGTFNDEGQYYIFVDSHQYNSIEVGDRWERVPQPKPEKE